MKLFDMKNHKRITVYVFFWLRQVSLDILIRDRKVDFKLVCGFNQPVYT
jgi:hypothetical protein